MSDPGKFSIKNICNSGFVQLLAYFGWSKIVGFWNQQLKNEDFIARNKISENVWNQPNNFIWTSDFGGGANADSLVIQEKLHQSTDEKDVAKVNAVIDKWPFQNPNFHYKFGFLNTGNIWVVTFDYYLFWWMRTGFLLSAMFF